MRWGQQRNCITMVADSKPFNDQRHGDILGFMIYEVHKSKLHILNFAVHPEYRRCGIGCQMAEKLMSKLSINRHKRIVSEVRETNLDAQLFFRSVGFRATGVSREFFPDSGEDAYVMEYLL